VKGGYSEAVKMAMEINLGKREDKEDRKKDR